MARHRPSPPVILVGAPPAEGHATPTRLGVPLVRIVGPGEPLPQAGPGVLTVHRAPHRDDSTSRPEPYARLGDHLPVRQHSHERPGHVVVGAGSRDELHPRVPAVEEALSPVLHHASDPVAAAPPLPPTS